MQDTLFQPVPIVDVNQIPDEELKQQSWVGALSMAMKYIRVEEMTTRALEALKILPILDNARAREIRHHLLAYLFNTGNIDDMEGFVEASGQLPNPTRNEIMSLAEKLEARGEARGEVRGEVRGEANLLIQLLEAKFGTVTELNQKRIKSAGSETLLRWGKLIFEAESVEQLLAK